MGRSVNYHSSAYAKMYLHYEIDEDEELDPYISQENWDYYKDYIIDVIQSIVPSTVKKETMGYNYDTHRYAIGILITK